MLVAARCDGIGALQMIDVEARIAREKAELKELEDRCDAMIEEHLSTHLGE